MDLNKFNPFIRRIIENEITRFTKDIINMTEGKILITRNMAMIPERNYYRFMGLQTLVFMSGLSTAANSILACFGHPEISDPLELTPITKVYLCPPDIVMPYNKDYIILAFDYEPIRTGMEIVRIPDRYNTTHFKEKISLN